MPACCARSTRRASRSISSPAAASARSALLRRGRRRRALWEAVRYLEVAVRRAASTAGARRCASPAGRSLPRRRSSLCRSRSSPLAVVVGVAGLLLTLVGLDAAGGYAARDIQRLDRHAVCARRASRRSFRGWCCSRCWSASRRSPPALIASAVRARARRRTRPALDVAAARRAALDVAA